MGTVLAIYYSDMRRILEITLVVATLAVRVATASAGTITSTAAGGDWQNTNTWVGGVVPAATDDVVIAPNAKVYVWNSNALGATTTCKSLTIGNGTQFPTVEIGGDGNAHTLIVTGNVVITAGAELKHRGTFNSVHTLQIGGNLTNSGTLDMLFNSNRYIILIFDQGTNTTLTGGGVYDLARVTFNKSVATATITNQATGFWTTQAWTYYPPVVYTSGIYVHDNTSTWNATKNLENQFPFATVVTIGANSGVKILQGAITYLVGTPGNYLTLDGSIEVAGGTLSVGDATDERIIYETGADFTISSGALNCAGRFTSNTAVDTITWNQSGGTVTLCTVGSSSAVNGSLTIPAAGSSFTMTGGFLILQRASTAVDYQNLAGTSSVTLGTVQMGNASTPTASLFAINSTVPVPNLEVDGSAAVATKPNLQLNTNNLTVKLSVTIDAGCTLNSNGRDLTVGAHWTNNGTFTQGTRTVTFNGTATQTIGGSSNTTFYNLTLSGAGTRQFADTANSGKAFETTNAFSWTDGDLIVGNLAGATSAIVRNTSAVAANANVTIPAAKKLTVRGGSTLWIGGAYAATTGIRINSGFTLTATGTASIDLGDSWTNNGTFTANSSTVTIYGISVASVAITGSSNTAFNVLNLGTTMTSGSKTVNIGHTTAGSALTTTAATLNLGSTTAGVTITANLGNNGVGNNTVAQTLTVTGTLTINATGTNSLVSVGALAHAINVGGNWSNAGTFTAGSSTVTFNGGAAQTITSGGTGAAKRFNILVVNQSPASTVTVLTNPIETVASLTVTAGTLDLGAPAGSLVGTTLTLNGGSLTFGTGAQNPSVTVSGNFSKSSGTLTMNSATDLLDVNGNFTVSGGASSLTDGDVYVAGNLDVSGGSSFIAPTAHLLRMDGGVDRTIVVIGASNTLGTLQILKTASTNKVTTAGNVTAIDINVEEGILEILAHTVTVSDDATSFDLVDAGAELRMQTAGGVLNARGDFIMGPSSAVTISAGTIYIGDDLSANAAGAAFDPTGGTVIFAVTPANSIQRVFLDANDFFQNLTIAPLSTTTSDVWQPETTATLTVNGNFTINAAPAGGSAFNVYMAAGGFQFTLDLAGNFTMVTGAFPTVFNPSSVTHAVGGSWDDSGGVFQPTAGTIALDGGTATTVATGAANYFHHFTVSKTSLATMTTALVAKGNVTIASGELDPNGFNIAVAGNWDDAGGTFAPAAATVTFNAVAPVTQTITAGATNNFFTLTLNQSGGTPGVNALDLQTNVTVKSVLAVTAGRMNLRTNTLTLQGGGVTHTIGASGALRHFKNAEDSGASDSTLLLGNASTLSVSGWYIARYSLDAGDTGRAIADADGGGANRYSIVVNSGGNLWIRQARFNRLNASGLQIQTGSILNEIVDAIFDVGTASGCYLNFAGTTGVDRANFPYTCFRTQFLAGPEYSVRAAVGTPLIRFHGATGALAGEVFDDDPSETDFNGGRILWESNHIRNVNTGETFSTIEDAINDPDTAANHVIRLLSPGVIETAIDFSVWGKDVVLENFTLYSRTGTTVKGGGVLRGQLQNCAIARGAADYVALRNCTLFDPTGGTLTVTNCAAENSVFEEGAPGVPSGDVNNRKGVLGTIFVDAAALDFHLAANDGGTTQGTPGGWIGSALDWEGHARTGSWDRGADEFVSVGVTKLNADVGSVSRFHFIALSRGSSSSTNGFAYLTSRGGSTVPANDNRLYVVDLTTMTVVDSEPAVGPIVNMTFWVDVTTADGSWRAWIYLIVDTNGDGHGDSIQLIVDRGDAGLWHPNKDLSDPDPYDRRFGSVDYYGDGTRYVYRPGAAVGDYRIRTVTLAQVPADIDDDAPAIDHTVNKVKWNRMFFSAYKTTATTGGALFKVNADVYDTVDNANAAFGGTMWSIKPGDAGYLYNYDYRAPLTFTWASSFREIFVSVSGDGSQNVLVRYSMVGLTAPSANKNWRATEEAGASENRYGATLDNGNTGAACTYGMSDGTVVYNRNVESGSGEGGLRWATRVKQGGTPKTPVLAPQRFWPNAFALVAYEGGVDKIWSLDGSDARNGCLASTGEKLDIVSAPKLDEIFDATAQDLDWPMACEGKPIQKIWVRGTKIYFGTDKGFVYGRNWNRDGSSVASPNEPMIGGYPYAIPGGRITWIFVHPNAGVLVGTDNGGLYRFAP